jgi:hypothetical protein
MWLLRTERVRLGNLSGRGAIVHRRWCQDLQPERSQAAKSVDSNLDEPDLWVEAFNEANRKFVFRFAAGGDSVLVEFDQLDEVHGGLPRAGGRTPDSAARKSHGDLLQGVS